MNIKFNFKILQIHFREQQNADNKEFVQACMQCRLFFALNSRKQKQFNSLAGLLTYSRFERLPEI